MTARPTAKWALPVPEHITVPVRDNPHVDQGIAISLAGLLTVGAAAVAVVGSLRAGRIGAEAAIRAAREQSGASERAQLATWAREDKHRWGVERRGIYARLLAAADGLELPASLALEGKSAPPFDADAEIGNLILAHTELDLVASDEVRGAAALLVSATVVVMQAALVKAAGGQPPGAEYSQVYAERRAAFVEAARKELGLPVYGKPDA